VINPKTRDRLNARIFKMQMFQTIVLNFDNLNFGFVSHFDIRISDFIINFGF